MKRKEEKTNRKRHESESKISRKKYGKTEARKEKKNPEFYY